MGPIVTIALYALPVGAQEPAVITVEDTVQFDFDSAEVTGPSTVVVEKIGAMLIARPDWQVTLVGHTDRSGPGVYNFVLSLRRALAVRDALIDVGVSPDAVVVRGDGPIDPAADNETSEGRAENRRIEFLIRTG